MAIVFTKQKKSQRTLIIFSALAILISAFVLWQVFLRKEAPNIPTEVVPTVVKRIDINFAILERIKGFQSFSEIKPLEETTPTDGEGVKEVKIGRENPFLPYQF